MGSAPIQTRHLFWTITDPSTIPSGGGKKEEGQRGGAGGGGGEGDDGPPGTLLEHSSFPNRLLYSEKQRERRGHSPT